MAKSLPTRKVSESPDLDQLKRQAKELLAAFRAGEEAAVREVEAHYRGADPGSFALAQAQLVLARAYGFDSWPKLKAFVDGATVRRLVDVVRAGDGSAVAAMLDARPELVNFDVAENDEHRAIHHAVLTNQPEMVRLLMDRGADARKGIYPHRGATGALTLARERGLGEIVAIIEAEEELRRRSQNAVSKQTLEPLFQAILKGEHQTAMALIEADEGLVGAQGPQGFSALHVAAATGSDGLVEWLLTRGADPEVRAGDGRTPLDVAAGGEWSAAPAEKVQRVCELLRSHGARASARSAVAAGDADWLRARHAEGKLENEIGEPGGLLTAAVVADRPQILGLLIELGFDVEERRRVEDLDETVESQGAPLWHCAKSGRYEMAEMLLEAGASPNSMVYASGTPVFQAYGQGDRKMIELLKRYGGKADASTLAHYRETEAVGEMLAEADAGRLPEDAESLESLCSALLWAGACGGDPEIVRMALERLDWAPGNERWYSMMEQPLRMWNHGLGFWSRPDWDRDTYFDCFRLIVERADVNMVGRWGLTILHDLAGARRNARGEDLVRFGTIALDAGARLDVRDELLKSTPLGWACRWGRVELARLLLERGADPVEQDAEAWATPRAWAEKMGRAEIVALLE